MPVVLDTLTVSPDPTLGGKVYGVAVAQVLDNFDSLSLGRVQLSLPWLPGFEPWARVAVLSAGSSRGTWFIPQVGDEVLVAFEQGDVTAPYVIGSLWNASDKPPADSPTDPTMRRIVKTPAGHVIELDDTKQSITITSSSGQKIAITPEKIDLSAGNGASEVTLETAGTIKLKASVKLDLQAPQISISGTTLELSGDATATLKASGSCTVKGAIVQIN